MAHVAAQVAAWGKRWPSGQPGPLSALGSPATSGPEFPTETTVAIYYNGVWNDITSDCRYEGKLRVKWGRSANDSRTRPGQASFMLNNRDGKYSPRNPQSPLYGLIGRNTPVRITHRSSVRAVMEIPEWPTKWTTGGLDAWTSVQAAGILRRLLAPSAPVLQSSMRKTIDFYDGTPIMYFPMEEGRDTLLATDVINGFLSEFVSPALASPGQSGAAQWGEGDLGPGSKPVLETAGLGMAFRTPKLAPLAGSVAFEYSSKYGTEVGLTGFGFIDVEMDRAIEGRHIEIQFRHGLDGVMELYAFECATGGAVLTSTALYSGTDNVFDGLVRHVYFQAEETSGTAFNWGLFVNGELLGFGNYVGVFTNPPWTGKVSQVFVGSTVTVSDTTVAMGHVALYDSYDVVSTPQRYLGLTGWAGENAVRRMTRLCDENGIYISVVGDLDEGTLMGAQEVDKLIQHLYDAEEADMGILYERRDLIGLEYRTRRNMYNQGASVTFDYAASGNIDTDGLVLAEGDQGIINNSNVHRRRGGEYRFIKDIGPMNNQEPPTGIGNYEEEPELILSSDLQLPDIAAFRVFRGTIDEQRIDAIKANIGNIVTNHSNGALADSIMAANMGDRVDVANTPIWLPPDDVRQILLGTDEWWDQFEHEITIQSTSATAYQVAILNLAENRVDAGSSFLLTEVDSVTTTLSVGSFDGSLWITTATHPTHFPLDIKIDGVRLRVTAITGASSPQSFTVTRSMDGFDKTLRVNSEVHVLKPIILAL